VRKLSRRPHSFHIAQWHDPASFWSEAFALRGAPTRIVAPRVLVFGLIAAFITLLNKVTTPELGVDIAPYEVAGALLGLLLVVRTSAGYERWWEARKAWGGIVNQSRNLVIGALAYGPNDRGWRERLVRCTVALPHVARGSLRGEHTSPQVVELLGPERAVLILASDHRPSFVAHMISEILREALERHGLNMLAFAELERQRCLLIDHVGTCERILQSPLPKVNSIIIRRFIFLFLTTLPFALMRKVDWLTPFVTVLVAYPILSLDQMGVELQNPFDIRNLSHLRLSQLTQKIERNLFALLAEAESENQTPGQVLETQVAATDKLGASNTRVSPATLQEPGRDQDTAHAQIHEHGDPGASQAPSPATIVEGSGQDIGQG
jgi:putative membrane protein